MAILVHQVNSILVSPVSLPPMGVVSLPKHCYLGETLAPLCHQLRAQVINRLPSPPSNTPEDMTRPFPTPTMKQRAANILPLSPFTSKDTRSHPQVPQPRSALPSRTPEAGLTTGQVLVKWSVWAWLVGQGGPQTAPLFHGLVIYGFVISDQPWGCDWVSQGG